MGNISSDEIAFNMGMVGEMYSAYASKDEKPEDKRERKLKRTKAMMKIMSTVFRKIGDVRDRAEELKNIDEFDVATEDALAVMMNLGKIVKELEKEIDKEYEVENGKKS